MIIWNTLLGAFTEKQRGVLSFWIKKTRSRKWRFQTRKALFTLQLEVSQMYCCFSSFWRQHLRTQCHRVLMSLSPYLPGCRRLMEFGMWGDWAFSMHVYHNKDLLILDALVEKPIQEDELEHHVIFPHPRSDPECSWIPHRKANKGLSVQPDTKEE